MMKKLFCIALGLIAVVAMQAQTTDPVVLTIDGEPVYWSEFDYIYNKNNSGAIVDKKTPEEYMDLFINFKLKVKEAMDQGLDTLSTFKQEFNGYRMQLAKPYMTDSVTKERLLRQAYDRRLRDVKVAHVAIKCAATAAPADTLAAYQKALEAYQRLTGLNAAGRKVNRPEDFSVVAKEMSDDPSVEENEGIIGWVSVFRTVYPFEEAAYNTKVGTVCKPVRSPFGYHVIKVLDSRVSPGEMHASHIMLFTQRDNEAYNEQAKQRIDSLYTLLRNGADFADLARQYSMDRGSSVKGGDLGWVASGQLVAEFEDALFAMKHEGDISKPIRSPYGWHIIQMQEKREWASYDEMRPMLEQKLNRDSRAEQITTAFYDSLKAKYGDLSKAELEELFVQDMEKQNTEFGNLMREYHDGILLFDISNREVWEKAAIDHVGLGKYFVNNRDQYKWDALHFNGYVVYCKDETTQKQAFQIAKHSMPDSLTSYLTRRLNDSIQYVKVQHVLCAKGDSSQMANRIVQSLLFSKVTKPKVICQKALNTPNGSYAIEDYPYVIFAGDMMAQPESYQDVRGQVTSDYQDYLEKVWIEELRTKHQFQVNQPVWLNKIK